jgi:hypothetical protein
MAINSAFCWSVGSPGLDGQQEFPTVATQTARNSRAGGGGTIFSTAGCSLAANKFAASAREIKTIKRSMAGWKTNRNFPFIKRGFLPAKLD